jgi:colanic acid/amylovoran biosynthesis glycosyltransferase
MPFGPEEAFLIPEVQEILRRGCEVLIVPRSPHGAVVNRDAQGLEERSRRTPLFCGEIAVAALAEMLRRPAASLRALAWLLLDRNVRSLAKNLSVYPKALWIARLARQWGADHIHVHWISTTATMALVAGEVCDIPWSCTAHRGDIVLNNLLALKTAKAAFVRYISESGARIAAELGVRAPASRAAVIHVGVTIPAVAMTPPALSPPVLLCPAHLYPVKGHKHLLQAMAILQKRNVPCLLEIAGEGGLLVPLEKLVGELSLGRVVRFLGSVPHDKILQRYQDREVTAVVLPSVDLGRHEHEGIPATLIEAMAHGVPVISTSTGGIPELLQPDAGNCSQGGGKGDRSMFSDGVETQVHIHPPKNGPVPDRPVSGDEAGILVPPQDPLALADAIERLLCDAALWRRLAEAGRRRVQEGWAVENVVTALLSRIEAARKDDPRPPATLSHDSDPLPVR